MCYRWVESTYTLRRASFRPIATVAAVIVILFWLLVELRKPSSFLCVYGQFVNITFRYHIVNNGFGDSKIFNTNILVKLAIAYMMIWCFIL